MSDDDLQVASSFLAELAAVGKSGNRDRLYPLLAADVVWVTPQRELEGLDEVRNGLTWVAQGKTLGVEFKERKLTDLGDGRIVANVHEVYRVRGTGDFAFERDRLIKVTIRDRRVARYEMRIVG